MSVSVVEYDLSHMVRNDCRCTTNIYKDVGLLPKLRLNRVGRFCKSKIKVITATYIPGVVFNSTSPCVTRALLSLRLPAS